jgi:predicted ATPase
MIEQIDLYQFKCFEELHLPIGGLTLLTGMNASGKSTVIQSLVLLHQTFVTDQWCVKLYLNGSKLQLGTASDVVDQVTGRSACDIGIQWHGEQVRWTFQSEARSDLALQIKKVARRNIEGVLEEFELDTEASHDLLNYLMPIRFPVKSTPFNPAEMRLAMALKGLVYLGAERIGPREAYGIISDGKSVDVGHRGENTPVVLLQSDDRQVLPGLQLPEAPPTLRRQTEAWLGQFFPGAGLDVQPVPNASMVTLGLRTDPSSNFLRPQNVGYGLTHILPIITACCAAEPGNLLLIENPEVHLHPAGQALMGRFLAKAAAAGVQLIIETHSDHVLNGIRRAVFEKELDANSVCIHFFTPRFEQADRKREQVITPIIDDRGNLDSWPDGFFDQIDKDLSVLTEW